MEKNQHKNTGSEQDQQTTGTQPGQQLPTGAEEDNKAEATQHQPERHSESSFPQQEGETLGTL